MIYNVSARAPYIVFAKGIHSVMESHSAPTFCSAEGFEGQIYPAHRMARYHVAQLLMVHLPSAINWASIRACQVLAEMSR